MLRTTRVFISQVNCFLLLGDIFLNQARYSEALSHYLRAAQIDDHNPEALKGIIACNSELGQPERTWELAQELNLELIKDPLIFLSLFQVGHCAIERLLEDGPQLHAEEIGQAEFRCGLFLNCATATANHADHGLLQQIAGHYFEIHNFQNAG